MHAPTPLTSGRTEGYGMGWVLTRYRGTPEVSHAGGHLARKITDEILDLPSHVSSAAPAGPVPAGLTGTYRDSLDVVQLSVTDDRLASCA